MAKIIKVYWDFDLDSTDLSVLSETLGLDEEHIEKAIYESEETLNELHDAFAEAVGVPVNVDLDAEGFDFENAYLYEDITNKLSDKYGWCVFNWEWVEFK